MNLVDHTHIRPRGLAAIALVAMCTALAAAGSLPPRTAAPPPAAPAEASTAPGATPLAQGHKMASHKSGSDDGGVRGHGFVLDNEVFTTIDAPGAILGTGPFGTNNRGQIVGNYIDVGGPTAGEFTHG